MDQESPHKEEEKKEEIDPNWSLDRIQAFKEANEQKLEEVSRDYLHIAVSFVRKIAPYVVGRENDFRTESFSALSREQKNSMYKEIESTIFNLELANNQEILEKLKGKITLVGEPGVSYENRELKVGPGATKEEILKVLAVDEKPMTEDIIRMEEHVSEVAAPALASTSETTTEEKKFKNEEIDGELLKKLKDAGVKIEIVEALMNLAMYYDDEKTLKIREDADADHVNQFIKDIVFPTLEESSLTTPEQKPNISENGGFKIGEKVQWVSGGVVQFEKPKPITHFDVAPDGDVYAFFEGNQTGVLVSQLEHAVSEKDLNEKWEEFVKLRNDLAKTEALKNNFSVDSGIKIEELKEQYIREKEKIAELIRKDEHDRLGLGESPLTKEQESDLNDYLFEELVKKENDDYLSALRANRKETWKDKTIETTKNILSTKAVKWYLGLSKKQRIALSFGIGTIAGLTFGTSMGALGAAGYVGKRILTGSAGIAAGELANKRWSIEELKQKEKEEIENLKNPDHSLEEKTQLFKEIEKKYKKERTKMMAKRVGVTMAVGAGTGFLANLAENTFFGTGGAARSVVESQGVRSNAASTRIPRGRFELQPEPKPKTGFALNEPEAPSEVSKEIFADPKVLIHEVKAGDSTWKILKDTLENNEQFKGMTEAQKTYVLSTFTNKALENPTEYGLGDGAIHVGDKTNFTKLFEDTKGVESIFDKAKQTIVEGGPQEKSILANNEKIAAWINEHPGSKLTNDKVNEILNYKPKVVEPVKAPVPETLEPSLKVEPLKVPISENPIVPKPESLQFGNNETLTAAGAGLVGAAALGALNKEKGQGEQIQKEIIEIAEAKKRLAQLEAGKRNPNLERTFSFDSNKAKANIELEKEVEENLIKDINKFFTEGLIFKEEGIKSKKWNFIRGISFSKLVKYFRGDSNKSGLSLDVANELGKSDKYRNFVDYIIWLREQLVNKLKSQNNDAVILFNEDEPIEQIFRKVGRYLKEQQHSAQYKKAA